MNIIEAVKALIESFPRIVEAVHTEFPEGEEGYGLSSTGDTLISEDILGDQKRRHSFILWANYSGINDYERKTNSGALLELAQYLDQQSAPVTAPGMTGQIDRISTANGMLVAVPQENRFDTMQYQLQITAEYSLYIE